MKKIEFQRNMIQIQNEDSVTSYYKIRQQLKKLTQEMLQFIHQPKYVLPFLQPGRLVAVKSGEEDFGWGTIINFQKKRNQKVRPWSGISYHWASSAIKYVV